MAVAPRWTSRPPPAISALFWHPPPSSRQNKPNRSFRMSKSGKKRTENEPNRTQACRLHASCKLPGINKASRARARGSQKEPSGAMDARPFWGTSSTPRSERRNGGDGNDGQGSGAMVCAGGRSPSLRSLAPASTSRAPIGAGVVPAQGRIRPGAGILTWGPRIQRIESAYSLTRRLSRSRACRR
jgi:hypothetical protein